MSRDLMNVKQYKCPFEPCDKIYSHRDGRRRHIINMHTLLPRTKIFKCDQCSKQYYTKSHLNRHIQESHTLSTAPRPLYLCNICGTEFKTKQGRNDHVVAHIGEKSYSCKECPLKFSSGALLYAHRKRNHTTVTTLLLFKCSICPKQYKERKGLQGHEMRKHSTEKRRDFICGHCQKSFFSKNDLRQHEIIHKSRSRDFVCHICQKSFFTKSTMRIHKKTHNPFGSWACYFCRTPQATPYALINHLRSHTNEKPFICHKTNCGYSGRTVEHFNSHVKLHHPALLRKNCYFCGKTFPDLSQLEVHLRNHTLEEPFPCVLCRKLFKSWQGLRLHIRSHTKEKSFKCPHCPKFLSTKGSLAKHQTTFHGWENRYHHRYIAPRD